MPHPKGTLELLDIVSFDLADRPFYGVVQQTLKPRRKPTDHVLGPSLRRREEPYTEESVVVRVDSKGTDLDGCLMWLPRRDVRPVYMAELP